MDNACLLGPLELVELIELEPDHQLLDQAGLVEKGVLALGELLGQGVQDLVVVVMTEIVKELSVKIRKIYGVL